jgi:hypothetical protein
MKKMGRVYTWSTILKAYSQRLNEAIENYNKDQKIASLLYTIQTLADDLKQSATDWRLPEEQMKRLNEKLNSKRSKEFEQAVRVIEDTVEDMRREFDVWSEDEDGDRVYHI